MHGLLQTHCESTQNFTKFSTYSVNETVKVESSILEKAKNKFLSLLVSIKNTFKSMVNFFSYTNENNHDNTEKKSNTSYEVLSSAKVFERELASAIRSRRSMPPADNSRRDEFNRVKTEMHTKLAEIFKKDIQHKR